MSNYRLLKLGETILKGDESYSPSKNSFRPIVGKSHRDILDEGHMPIRRRIKGYVPVEVYETVYAIENITEHNIETINECMDIVMSLANSNFPIMDSKMESDITDVRLKLDDKRINNG